MKPGERVRCPYSRLPAERWSAFTGKCPVCSGMWSRKALGAGWELPVHYIRGDRTELVDKILRGDI